MEVREAWYRVSVKALIYNSDRKFLLIKEKNGFWDLPGGGLDHGENQFNCLERELLEEMGLKIKEILKDPKFFITAYKSKSKTRPWIANICYEVVVRNLNFKKSNECVEIGFFNKNSASKLRLLPNVIELLKLM